MVNPLKASPFTPFKNDNSTRKSYQIVKGFIDQLLLQPELFMSNRKDLRLLRSECNSIKQMNAWLQHDLNSDEPADLLELILTVNQNYGQDSLIVTEDSNIITISTATNDDALATANASIATAAAATAAAATAANDKAAAAAATATATAANDEVIYDDVDALMKIHCPDPSDVDSADDKFLSVKNGNRITYLSEPAVLPVTTSNSYNGLANDDDDDDDDDNDNVDDDDDKDLSLESSNVSRKQRYEEGSQTSFSQNSTRSILDHTTDISRLRFDDDGYTRIDSSVYMGLVDKIGVEDLIWWISQTNKRNHHLVQNFRQAVSDKTASHHKRLENAFDKLVDTKATDLGQLAQAECNKINTVSQNLERTNSDARLLITKLTSGMEMNNDMIKSMEQHRHEYVNTAHFNALEKIVTDQSLKHQDEMEELRAEIRNLRNNTSTQPDASRDQQEGNSNSYFPNVRLNSRGHVHHVNDDIPPEPAQLGSVTSENGIQHPLPISSLIDAKYGGYTIVNGLVTDCLHANKGISYTVMSNDGRTHSINAEHVNSVDFSGTPDDKFPHGYITDTRDRQRPNVSSASASPGRRQRPYESSDSPGNRRRPYYSSASLENRQRPSSDRERYNTYTSDEDDESDTRHQPKREFSRKLAHNEFQCPIGTYRTIKEEKARDLSSQWVQPLGSNEDPRKFYTNIRNTVSKFNVLLLHYADITPESGLLTPTMENSVNYDVAKRLSSSFLFDLFNHGRDTMFEKNAYAISLLDTYAHDQDGLGFLEVLIREHHKNLRMGVAKSNITEACQLPLFLDHKDIVSYIESLKIYVQEIAMHLSQLDILRLVTQQLQTDPRFKTVAAHFSEKVATFIQQNTKFLDVQYSLANVARTVMHFYSPEERDQLCQPRTRQVTFNSLICSTDAELAMTANAFQRNKPAYNRSTSRDYKANRNSSHDDSTRSPNKRSHNVKTDDKEFCKGCRTYGHVLNDCNKVGAQITISQFLERLPKEDVQSLKKSYIDNRKKAHEKYLSSYNDRLRLKREIKCVEFDLFPTDEERLHPSEQDIGIFNNERNRLIVHALKSNYNLDFGSLDDRYEDLVEPILQFDPNSDNIE
jgi:hypothetical protein